MIETIYIRFSVKVQIPIRTQLTRQVVSRIPLPALYSESSLNKGVRVRQVRPLMTIDLFCVKTVLESYNPNLSFSFPVTRKMRTKKFMQTLDSKQFVELEDLAKKRGTNVQTFIRAIVIPEWLVTLQIEGPSGRSSPLKGQTRRLRERRVERRVAHKIRA